MKNFLTILILFFVLKYSQAQVSIGSAKSGTNISVDINPSSTSIKNLKSIDSIIAVADSIITGINISLCFDTRQNDYGTNPIYICGLSVLPIHGIVTFVDTSIFFIPDMGYTGSDSFSYILCDTFGNRDTAMIYIDVILCLPPHAKANFMNINQDSSTTIHILANDLLYGNPLQDIAVVDFPLHGTTVIIGDSTIQYVPMPLFCGIDAFKYYIKTLCGTDTAVVIIEVSCDTTSYSFVRNPESVEYDAVNNKYIASSPSDNKIYNVVNGSRATTLVSSVNSPYGMVCIGNNVYVCSGADVKGYNTTTGAQMFHAIVGGSFLDGLCSDGAGFLYATDFTLKKIFKINLTNSASSVFASTGTNTPNGILWDASAGRLVYCTWGTNAGLFAVNMSDSSVSSILNTTYSNFDGVVQDSKHNYFISSWGLQGILKVDSALTMINPVVTGLSNPADIYYNLNTDTLAVPNFYGDSVSFHFFGIVDSTADTTIDSTNTFIKPNSQIQYFNVFQNTNNDLICKWASSSKNDLNLNIYSINGEIILNRKITTVELADGYITIETNNMSNGIYLFSISDGIYTKTFKTSFQR